MTVIPARSAEHSPVSSACSTRSPGPFSLQPAWASIALYTAMPGSRRSPWGSNHPRNAMPSLWGAAGARRAEPYSTRSSDRTSQEPPAKSLKVTVRRSPVARPEPPATVRSPQAQARPPQAALIW